MGKRNVDIAILSDIHLGTYGSHAKEVLNYLKSIHPKTLILNGDIIDFWLAKKKYFPHDHLQVINEFIKLSLLGTKVYYITGNHDDVLRKMPEFSLGTIYLRDKLVLNYRKKKYWIFHGDVFDSSVKISPFLAKLGGKGYDWLILLNRFINRVRKRLGYSHMSFSQRIKSKLKRGLKLIEDFENIAVNLAIKKGFDFVICGHIHEPKIKQFDKEKGSVVYMNSGDWLENLTALECVDGEWSLYKYNEMDFALDPNEMLRINKDQIQKRNTDIHLKDLQKETIELEY